MVYADSRLRHVLLVFREAKIRDKESGPFCTTPRHLRNDYRLREVEPSLTFRHALAWQEDGSSEDEYDPTPSKKRCSTGSALRTPKKIKRVHPSGSEQSTPQTTQQHDVNPSSLFLTLRLQSDAAKKVLHDLAEEHGRGYKTDAAKHGKESASSNSEVSGDVDLPPREVNRLHRPEPASTYLGKLDEDSEKIDNAGGRVLRNRKIPDIDLAAQTRKCVACKAAKRKCSFLSGTTRLPACKRCRQNKVDCVLDLPDVEPKRESEPRVDLAEDVPQLSDLSQPLPKGNGAVAAIQPSVTTPTPSPTASQIIRSHVATRQYPFTTKIGASQEHPIVLDSPPSSPGNHSSLFSAPPESAGRLVNIRTYWAHPIQFKHFPTPGSSCHFCSDFRYGIYGYGEIAVQVIQYPDTLSYEETGDGHRAKGHEATRMCVNCALNRLYISRCRVHRFKKFAALSAARTC
ncbi:hypothetical protein A1O1_00750 [Capronia coronata CBS 617.96]|uniref:Zn(2)-C6 fungal-type domain-containing protein n=1 Tax=Capronia coronata CBS 617.96 TaxID=1182541 RepID=W9YSV4_9EURO|nr:uncharacterized protein A1O1_00750 [Capronia coronata CBS 617.96]EXJ95628.1 hypothetical protein A1O1_00750 [Capronia coronata CBS 617.96]